MPPRLEDVPDADVTVWVDAFEAADDPRLRSRLGDLIWSQRFGPEPHLAARQACEALVALSRDGDWQPMEATEGLVRALELSQELSDAELMSVVVARTLDVIAGELAARPDRPGISFTLLRTLVDLRPSQRPGSLLALVEQAESVYGADPHHVESAIELQVALVAPDARTGLRVRHSRALARTARNADGILRATFLTTALDLARRSASPTSRKSSASRSRRSPKRTSTSRSSPPTSRSTGPSSSSSTAHSWSSMCGSRASAAFGAYGPPGGEPDAVEEQVEQQMRDHPLPYLFPRGARRRPRHPAVPCDRRNQP